MCTQTLWVRVLRPHLTDPDACSLQPYKGGPVPETKFAGTPASDPRAGGAARHPPGSPAHPLPAVFVCGEESRAGRCRKPSGSLSWLGEQNPFLCEGGSPLLPLHREEPTAGLITSSSQACPWSGLRGEAGVSQGRAVSRDGDVDPEPGASRLRWGGRGRVCMHVHACAHACACVCSRTKAVLGGGMGLVGGAHTALVHQLHLEVSVQPAVKKPRPVLLPPSAPRLLHPPSPQALSCAGTSQQPRGGSP